MKIFACNQLIVQKVPPNGHNYPLTEPKCKYLGILDPKSFSTKFAGVNNWREYFLHIADFEKSFKIRNLYLSAVLFLDSK
jgi:hypothetical protein